MVVCALITAQGPIGFLMLSNGPHYVSGLRNSLRVVPSCNLLDSQHFTNNRAHFSLRNYRKSITKSYHINYSCNVGEILMSKAKGIYFSPILTVGWIYSTI